LPNFFRLHRHFAFLFFAAPILLIFEIPLAAQTKTLTEALDGNGSTPAIGAPAIEATATQPPALPENPHPHRVLDVKFIAAMGSLGASESLRFTTRQLVLEHEMTAGAPWVTSVPSHSHLVFKYAPIFAAELAAAYEIKKPHRWLPGDRVIRKLWWVYPVAMTAVHVHNAIGNIRTQAPSGECPIAECQQP
jgi:hypothetical protein